MSNVALCFFLDQVMDQPRRVSQWSVVEVLDWLQCQCPAYMNVLQKAIIKHDIAGRALVFPLSFA